MTLKIYSNGTMTQTTAIETDNTDILALFGSDLEEGNSSFTWVNSNSNPDFSDTQQFYVFAEADDDEPEISEVNFTSSFTQFTIRGSDEGFVFIKQ